MGESQKSSQQRKSLNWMLKDAQKLTEQSKQREQYIPNKSPRDISSTLISHLKTEFMKSLQNNCYLLLCIFFKELKFLHTQI